MIGPWTAMCGCVNMARRVRLHPQGNPRDTDYADATVWVEIVAPASIDGIGS